MERKFLEKLGLEGDVIEKILSESAKLAEAQKADQAAKDTELEKANSTIKELQATVAKFDGVDVEKLKTDLSALQDKYNTDTASLRLNSALELAIVAGKAKNSKAVRALLDESKVKLDGGKLYGVEEQLEALRKSDAYLFEDSTPPTPPSSPAVSSGAAHGTEGAAATATGLLGALQAHYSAQ